MKIVIAGGSGLIGKVLVEESIARQHTVTILTRNPRNAYHSDKIIIREWDGRALGNWYETIEQADAIINLSGASIASGRWTKSRKTELLESRIHATRILAQAISLTTHRPSVFLNASAVGYYGNVEDVELTEDSPQGRGFLSDLCGRWEREALNVKEFGSRTVLLRTGVVLDKNGGALKKMILPFKLFGGPLGSGSQWISWIHIDDVVKAILFALETKSLQGPINLTSPHPITMRAFAKELGKVLHRPYWLPVPSSLLRILLGEMSSVLLEGQCAIPEKLTAAGFTFTYPTIH
jgi:uncharacterized protein (TIGR01777 family)